MLSVVWLVVAVVVAVVLTSWITFTLTRLDRLHARCDAAQASLDAQLVRRAAALQHVADSPDSGVRDEERPTLDAVAQVALDPRGPEQPGERQAVENAVGRALADLVAGDDLRAAAAAELTEAAARVMIALRFYNDAVRDTRALRAGRLPRLFRMAGRRALPEFFDIDDTVPERTPVPVPLATSVTPTEQDRA